MLLFRNANILRKKEGEGHKKEFGQRREGRKKQKKTERWREKKRLTCRKKKKGFLVHLLLIISWF